MKEVAEYRPNEIDEEYYRDEWMLPNATDEEERERIKNMSDDEIREKAYDDQLFWEDKFRAFYRQMGRLLRDISQRNKFEGYYVVTANNIGWRNKRGGKVIDVSRYDLDEFDSMSEAGKEFVREFMIDGQDASFEVERERNKLYMTRYHHDSPQGETFNIRPLTAEEVRQYDRHGESAILEDHKDSGVHP